MYKFPSRFRQASLLALILLLAACAPQESATQTQPAPTEPPATEAPAPTEEPAEVGESDKRGGDLVFARREDNTSMDPCETAETETIYVLKHIFETLYVTSQDGRSVDPWLATGQELADDNVTWTIHLRSGVKFSDGTPMTAEDVKFSIERAQAESSFAFLLTAIDTIEVVDQETITIKTKYPWSPLLADLSLWSAAIVPKDFGGVSKEEFFENPVGTGPFVFDEWERGSYLRVVRNPNYWQEGKPYLDSVTWRQVPDANTRVLQLEGGQAHIASEIPYNLTEGLQETEGVNAEAMPSTNVTYLFFNTTIEPNDDVHVRRAIAHAIDKEALAEATQFGFGGAACSIVSPWVPYYDPETPCLEYDLQKAEAELAQSSVPEGFETEFLVADQYAPVAEIIQSQLAPLGINVSIRVIEAGQLYETMSRFDYELARHGWTMDIPDPDEQISFMLDPEQGGSDCYCTGYNNPEVTQLVRDAQKAFSEEERREIYSEIQAIHAAEVPQIPLTYQPQIFGWTEGVNDFDVNPVGDRHLENVWLSDQ